MRVMCISHERFGDDLPYGPNDPQIGDECVVIRSCIGYDEKGKGFPSYELKGYVPYLYDQRNFAILPDETADEMQEESREAIVNLETVLV